MPDHSNYNIDAAIQELTCAALRATDGNRTKAAKLLGVSLRTLRNWITKWDLAKIYPAGKK